jgi:hypothetical protein
MARSSAVLKSIQAEPKRSHKSSTARLQAKSLRGADNVGLPWDDDDVARIVAGIERDETSFEMAQAVRRSYYGTMAARAHVAFALRHANALYTAIRHEVRTK